MDDHAYGQSAAKSLARSNPTRASDNADNHEYIAENTPAQNRGRVGRAGEGRNGSGDAPVFFAWRRTYFTPCGMLQGVLSVSHAVSR
ncbi:M35 family metallo-endopeptidase [Cystobacter fuscus]|uniref:M35 family metallo-endopeptidase n=1 Tax=Cystobacter fuscus TaxID=43 RepID=UPI001FDFB7C7|nr:M35 family metallo-endopeptidase [Cystobacter fuscus]